MVGLAAFRTVGRRTIDSGVRVGVKGREEARAREFRGVFVPEEFLVRGYAIRYLSSHREVRG